MSLSNPQQQWSLDDLKDKDGHPPTTEIFDFIKKFDKKSLLPCPRAAADLAMPKNVTVTPREMNSFIVFRRQLAHVAKQMKKSDDGKVLSKAASYIWRGASKSEKDSYVRIAKELKDLHYQTYPTYSYERRKRKTAEDDFIFINPDTIKQSKKKKNISEATSIPIQTSEAECAPTLTLSLPEQVNENWFDPHIPLTLYDNSFASNQFTSQNSFNNLYLSPGVEQDQVEQGMLFYNEECDQSLREDEIPRVFQTLLESNYTTISPQGMQDMRQALYLDLLPQSQLPQQDSFFYYGDSDAGMNQNSSMLPLERPIDDFLNLNL